MWLIEIEPMGSLLAFYIFCAVSSLNLLLALANIILGYVFKVNSPGSSMGFYMSLGGIVWSVTVLLRGFPSDWLHLQAAEKLCQVFPSLLMFGLLWMFGGLMLRCCSIVHCYRTASDAKQWVLHAWMGLLMAIDVVLLLVWNLEFKVSVDHASIFDLDFYACSGASLYEWEVIVSIIHVFPLLVSIVMVWPALYYSRKQATHTESVILSVVTCNLLIAVAVGTLFFYQVLLYVDPATNYAINGGLIQYAVFSTLLLMLISKIKAVQRSRRESR